jgi:hypothetical protein
MIVGFIPEQAKFFLPDPVMVSTSAASIAFANARRADSRVEERDRCLCVTST